MHLLTASTNYIVVLANVLNHILTYFESWKYLGSLQNTLHHSGLRKLTSLILVYCSIECVLPNILLCVYTPNIWSQIDKR